MALFRLSDSSERQGFATWSFREATRPPLPTGGRMPPIRTSGKMKTLAFHHAAQGKSGTKPELSVKLIQPVLRRESLGRIDLSDIADVL